MTRSTAPMRSPTPDGAQRGGAFNPVRGQRVVARGRVLLDQAAPLAGGSHADATGYAVKGGKLEVTTAKGVLALSNPAQFVGYRGDAAAPSAILLKNHGLHLRNPGRSQAHPSARPMRPASTTSSSRRALTTIMDCEDSVAAVDADDKVQVYRNWLGLMTGELTEEVTKNGKTFTRRLNADREYTAPDGSTLTLHGRSLMFIRIRTAT